MTSNTVMHIVNSALLRLGEKPLTSLEQGTNPAAVVRELYPDCRDTLLSWQAWPFATIRARLPRLSAAPAMDYAYYYALPTNPALVRVIDIDLLSQRISYQREVWVNPSDPTQQQAVIATTAETVNLRYVGLTNEGLWSPLFVSTLAVYLAQAVAPSISGKASLKQSILLELYGQGREPGLLAKLRDMAGYEDSPRVMPLPDDYLLVRESHGWGDSAPTHMLW